MPCFGHRELLESAAVIDSTLVKVLHAGRGLERVCRQQARQGCGVRAAGPERAPRQALERNAANVSKIRKKLRLEAPAQEIAAAGVAIKDAKQVVALALILRLVLGRSNSGPLDTADARGQAVAQLKGQIAELPVDDASNELLETFIAKGTAGVV